MSRGQTHYEIFTRKTPTAPWALDGAAPTREQALVEAEAALGERRVVAVRVVKEEWDPETHEFTSIVIVTRGEIAVEAPIARREQKAGLACVAPPDFYTLPAREQIARLLDGWLRRRTVTAWELLHRPDLAEALDRSSNDLQGALQKLAIASSGGGGPTLHDQIRTLQALTDAAIARVVRDGRRGAFPSFAGAGGDTPLAAAAARLQTHSEGTYLFGGGVAARLATASGWGAKIAALVELASAAPGDGPARDFALGVLEQPLAEILGSHAALAELASGVGTSAEIDSGHELAMLTRLAAGVEIEQLIAEDPSLAAILPPLEGPAARLQALMSSGGVFAFARAAAARRVLTELKGPRRLHPRDAAAEIALVRGLGRALSAAAGALFPLEDVQAALIERSRRLIDSAFVEAYLAGRDDPVAESLALVELAETVCGPVNKTAATRWLTAAIGSLRFEKSVRIIDGASSTRLAALAELQRALIAADLPAGDSERLSARIGAIGAALEGDARLVASLGRSDGPPVTRLLLLLKMATGRSAPLGPAADRARAEALRLMREPDVRQELARRPDARARVIAFMEAAA